MMRWLCLLVLALLLAHPALAVDPREVLPDRALEARARAIGQELRCLVCQNQSIDDSNADLAHDLRVVVRERLQAGDTDQQVLKYMRARYGDFVLLRPPVEPVTWALWYGPPVVLLAALGIVLAFRRGRGPVSPPQLTAEEEARLSGVLGRDQG